jgi:hypothetical protein
MNRVALGLLLVGSLLATASSQSVTPRPPVIDMHVHSTNTSPQDQIARMTALNVRYVWVATLAPELGAWAAALPATQLLPGSLCRAGVVARRSLTDAVGKRVRTFQMLDGYGTR